MESTSRGPFLSHAKRGVHPADLLQPPSIPLFDRFQQAARGHIKLLTIAPEVFGALDLIAHAARQGVRSSLGHTNATSAEAQAGVRAGATSATHTFNAMRPLDHREPGVVGVVLDEQALYSELICDGIHVAPQLIRLWLRLKQERAILVTDAISATGMPDGPATLAGLPVTVAHGPSLAHQLPRNAGRLRPYPRLRRRKPAGLHRLHARTAVRCASSQPAAMLGLADTIASLRTGQPASFNQYSATGCLEATYLHGHAVPAGFGFSLTAYRWQAYRS